MAVEFHKLYSEVSEDVSIPAPALKLYVFLLNQSNINTGETPPIYIIHLAEKFNRTKRTIQLWLKELINRGLIIRVLRKDKNIPKWNEASYFIIVHAKAHLQDNKRPAVSTVKVVNTSAVKSFSDTMQKISLGTETQFHGKRDFRIENQNLKTLNINGGQEPKREPKAPQDSESFETVPTSPTAETPAVSENVESVSTALTPVIESVVRTAETQKPIDKTVNHDSSVISEAIAESGTPKKKPVDKAADFDLSVVPEAMRSAVEYALKKADRRALTENELCIIKELESKYTTEQIMKVTDKAIAWKRRTGRNIRQVTFNLIRTMLYNQYKQASKVQCKNHRLASVKAPTTARNVQQVQETLPDVSAPILPVEKAESIISEYAPAKSEKKEAGISPERKEFLESIRAHQDELKQDYWYRYSEWEDTFEADRDETPPEQEPFTIEDYLRLKFPEATEAELRLSSYCSEKDLKKAFEYDCKCASCDNPETCPFNKKNGRAVVVLKEVFGRKILTGAWTMNIGCKHSDADKGTDKPNPEFEQRLKDSGLTEWQSKQTFETFEHAGTKPEVVSAKAKSILAAKNQTSLVLAGKPGTGKTHLAIAIAIDAMKSGRNAIFMTVPDLLDELARADWEHDDFFGLRQKFRDVPCLVLDDLGKEKSTPKKLEYLYQIINYRYNHGLQTIITTNAYDMNELVNNDNAKVIEPLVSRVLQNGEWVTIREAENHRL